MGILWLWECAKPLFKQNLNPNFPSAPFHPVQTQVKALGKKKKNSSASFYIYECNILKRSHIYLQLKFHLLVCEQNCGIIWIWG